MELRKSDRFRGVNNRLPPDRLRPLGDREAGVFVPDASNVDLTDAGTFQRRPGTTRVGADTNCRGLFSAGDHGYYAAGDKLKMLDGSGNARELATLPSPYTPVAFTHTPRGVVMSDNYGLSLLRGPTITPLAPEAPLSPTPVVVAGAGGLDAGAYGFVFMAVDADGMRSRPTFPTYVQAPEGAGVSVILQPHALDILVFVSAPNGEVFYHQGHIPAGQSSFAMSRHQPAGEPFVYRVMERLPPGGVMGYHKGRLLSASGPMLYYSQPYMLGLYRPDRDFISFDEPVTILASIDEGLWVCTTHHSYFLPGDDVAKATVKQEATFGATPGTLAPVPQSQDWMWASERGPVRTKGSQMVLLQDEQIAYAPAESGAGLVREENGLRSFVTVLAGAAPAGGAVMGSYMDAEVIK